MSQEDFLLKIEKELCKYSNIPKSLCDYILEATKKDVQEHLLPVILKEKERKVVFKRTDNLFKRAYNITKSSPVELLKGLDFHSKDTSLGRIDAVFAELRTIIFLNELNLYDITPLQAKQNEKCADFIATGGSDRYVIEVFCKISQSPPQTVDELKKDLEANKIITKPSTYEDDLFRYYINISKSKKIQLDNTAKKYKCNKKIMVMVLNDLNILGLLTYYEYLEILEKISTELDWGNNYHFGIVTGMTTLGIDMVEDVIYPRIRGNS